MTPVSGDLGLTPREVEKTLKETFQLAQLWSCVLLLDECDIFLAQRSKNEIKRNSLVSGKKNQRFNPTGRHIEAEIYESFCESSNSTRESYFSQQTGLEY